MNETGTKPVDAGRAGKGMVDDSNGSVTADDPVAQTRQRLLAQVREAIAQQRLRRLLLSRPSGVWLPVSSRMGRCCNGW